MSMYLTIYVSIQGRVVGVVRASGETKIIFIHLYVYVSNYLSIYMSMYLTIYLSIQGRVVGVVGASGGTKIISAVAQVQYLPRNLKGLGNGR